MIFAVMKNHAQEVNIHLILYAKRYRNMFTMRSRGYLWYKLENENLNQFC